MLTAVVTTATSACDGPDFYVPDPGKPDSGTLRSLLPASGPTELYPIEGGVVFVDRDGDGQYSAGDDPVVGARVFWETKLHARTDTTGRFQLVAPEPGLVWVRSPAGFSPQLRWAAVEAGPVLAELALTPSSNTGDAVTFIHATDTHLGTVSRELIQGALRQSVDRSPRPDFVAITGDLVGGSDAEQYAMLYDDFSSLGTAWVPVAGNHDLYDDGEAWRAQFGPSTYSFDSGGVHFVVIDNDMASVIDFLALDLSLVDDRIPVVVFGHFPPGLIGHPVYDDTPLLEAFAEHGVDYMFSGHWHTNRVMNHSTFVEYTTEPLARAGLDFTPGGFRVASWDPGTASLQVAHHTVVKEPILELVAPAAGSCVSPGEQQILVACEIGAAAPRVSISAGDWSHEMSFLGGWGYATSAVIPEGASSVTVTAELGSGGQLARQFEVCGDQSPEVAVSLADWPQFQGDAQHNGVREQTVSPPLAVAWSAHVGGHVHGGSPVLYQDRLYVPVVDLSDGSRGGMVALDAQTGEKLWEVREGLSTHNAPAAADGVVVFLGSDARLRAFAADTGAPLWSYDLGQGLSFASTSSLMAPSIQDGVVYAGVVRKFAALDLQTGEPVWQTVPYDGEAWTGGSYASPTILSDKIVASFGRRGEIVAWNRSDHTESWRIDSSLTLAMNTTPMAYDGRIYAAIGNSNAFALDTSTGALAWKRRLDPSGTGWTYSVLGTPVASGGVVVFATVGKGVVGLDSGTGEPLWTVEAGRSPVHSAGYPHNENVHQASPVIAGETVWVGGADGVLRAIDLKSGGLQWSLDLRAPILSAAVPAQDVLFVATWDGTVRALVSAGDDR